MTDADRVPLADLRAQYERIRPQIDAAIARVLSRGWFILGEEVRAFEEEFARACGVAHAVGVGSGTEAIHLTLFALGAREGREVIAPANTAVPTLSGISSAGAAPVLADVEETTATIDPESVAAAITPRTAAVVAVHLYGQCAAVARLRAICDPRGIAVVEDAAQAHGATEGGGPAGSLAAAAAFSFYPSKNLGAYGDGGAVTTSDSSLAARLRRLRNYGEETRYRHVEIGFNSRLDEIQAAILRAKLPFLEGWNEERRRRFAAYRDALAGLPLTWNEEAPGRRHVRHLCVVRVRERDAFRRFLAERGVETQIHYPIPIHLQEAYAHLGHRRGDFPVSEAWAESAVSLPLYPEMTDAAQERVCEAIRAWFARGA